MKTFHWRLLCQLSGNLVAVCCRIIGKFLYKDNKYISLFRYQNITSTVISVSVTGVLYVNDFQSVVVISDWSLASMAAGCWSIFMINTEQQQLLTGLWRLLCKWSGIWSLFAAGLLANIFTRTINISAYFDIKI